MIPRFAPSFGSAELTAALRPGGAADVLAFEAACGQAFGGQAIAFPYGRAALAAFLQSVGLQGADVILPSYTCSVVAHAVVLSGNTPVFVDNTRVDFNMDLDEVEAAITERTGAIIATHLFGFPLDVDRLRDCVERAERRLGRRIWIVQDCAHSFGARWHGRLVSAERDVALFGLNISKVLSAIFGGMLTCQDAGLASQVRRFRDERFQAASLSKSLLRFVYLLATYPAFQGALYGVVHWLQYETPLLNRMARAYHLDDEIRFPPDAGEQMLPIEARVGLVQLGRYPAMMRRRVEHATRYVEALSRVPGWQLPPLVEGATWSHFPVLVEDRAAAVKHFAAQGVHIGEVIEYSVAHLPSYARYAQGRDWPHARYCSEHMINLPVHPHLTDGERERVIAAAHRLH